MLKFFTPTIRVNKSGTYTLLLHDVPSDTVFSAALADLSHLASIEEKGHGKLILERNPAFTEQQLVDAVKPLVLALALRQTEPQSYALKYTITPNGDGSYRISLHAVPDAKLSVELMADPGIESSQSKSAEWRIDFHPKKGYPINQVLGRVQQYCDQFLARHA